VLESDDVSFVTATIAKTRTVSSVRADIFGVEKISKEYAGLNVCTVALDELEHGADTLAALNGIMDVREENVQLVRHTGSPHVLALQAKAHWASISQLRPRQPTMP
jgi:hypothetical protein